MSFWSTPHTDMLRFLCHGLGKGRKRKGRPFWSRKAGAGPLSPFREWPWKRGRGKNVPLLTPSLTSRSSGRVLVTSVSAELGGLGAREEGTGGGEALQLPSHLISSGPGPKSRCQLPPTWSPCLLAGSSSLTRSWALIILSCPWWKIMTSLVNLSPPGQLLSPEIANSTQPPVSLATPPSDPL